MHQGPPYPHPQAVPAAKKKMSCLVIALIVGGVGFLLLGPLAAMGIYGVRRYLSAAKTAEAKNTVGAIARGAKQSYEREQITSDLIAGDPSGEGVKHSLCGSAIPVPISVPRGLKYAPGTGGVDFDTGDAKTGWKCLKFSMTMPMYYQYSYTKGSSPISSSRGGPSVSGAESFEAAAQGDLDGDTDTSAFSIAGQADAAGDLRVSTQLFIADEFE